MRTLLLTVTLCASASIGADFAHSAEMNTTDKRSNDDILIIIGASYAADWGQPPLSRYRIVNKGVGGEESSQVLARFERDVLAHRPNTVLIWGHINDMFRAPRDQLDRAKERARANYRQMHEQAAAAGIETILATEVTLTIGDSWLDEIRAFIGKLRGRENYRVTINNHVKDVNAWLRSYAAEHNLMLLDFERAVDGGTGSRREEYSQEDGSHISPAGYEALTRYAQRAFSQRSGAAGR